MRARHKIIVNVPSVDSTWGPEMRKLFCAKPGWKFIGCDSSGNQARVLAWYLNNSDFINTLLHGDIHQYNADVLTRVLNTMRVQHTVKRGQAKRIFYAFLFGASGAKLWSYIFGNLDHEQGTQLKKGFLKEVPGFENLIKTLENLYGASKKYSDGYIPSLAGSRIYVDSFHKLLVYLLQAGEKITCSAALMLTAERLEERGIPYLPCIFMHDEIDFQVPEEYAEEAAAIGKSAFIDGPKLFGINIMSGDAKIGDTWYDVH
jgi:DNA polymerase I-like protein with 3'-5' exonuclease and polymerase domains